MYLSAGTTSPSKPPQPVHYDTSTVVMFWGAVAAAIIGWKAFAPKPKPPARRRRKTAAQLRRTAWLLAERARSFPPGSTERNWHLDQADKILDTARSRR